MADNGRYRDDQIRDRSSSRYGRDDEDDRGGGWRRVRSDSDLSRDSSRGGGATGSGSDWKSEDYGWGGDPGRGSQREDGGRDRQGGSLFGGSGRDREEGYDRESGRDRDRDRDQRRDRDREGGGLFGGSGRDREMGRERDSGRDRQNEGDRDRQNEGGWGRQNEGGWGRDDRGERSGGGWAGGRDDDMGRSSRGGGQQHGRDFGYDDRHEGLPIDETSRLIASNKVEGTAVYGSDGHRIGSIYNFMVEKRAGKIEYAVMTYGGFLGMGTRYYPLPWDILTYDTRLGGYRVEMTERDLERAPSFDRTNEPAFDRQYGDRVRGWYGLGTA